MKNLCVLLLAICSVLSAGPVIFQEDFENPNSKLFYGLKRSTASPASGKASAIEPNGNAQGSRTSYAYTNTLHPIKPNTWYRLTFKHRNDIKIGEITVAVQESKNDKKIDAEYYAWQRKALPLNINSWQTYTHEFKTLSTTKAFRLHLAFDNENSGGCAQWDDILIEEIKKAEPHLQLMPFRAAASYTDIPTRVGIRVVDGKQTDRETIVFHSTFHWKTLDLATEAITMNYRAVPKGSTLRATVTRAGKNHYTREFSLDGTGTASFSPRLDTLLEGKYIFTVELIRDSKVIESVSKELWRIAKAKYPTPQLPPIKTVEVGPNRQILVNGKIFHPVSFSKIPSVGGLLSHHLEQAKPSYPEYLKIFREQFAQTFFGAGVWKGERWDKLPSRKFAEFAVQEYKQSLDFAKENNLYCKVSFTIGDYRGKRFIPSTEDLTYIVNELKDHPALYAWYLDEPEVGGNPPEQMIEMYKTIKAADKNHIVHVNLCDPKKFDLYAPCTDIGSQDVYPFPMMSLEETDYRMKKLVQAFPTAPLEDYLQGFNFDGLPIPTFDQFRASLLMDAVFECYSLAIFAWDFHSQHCLQTEYELQSYMRTVLMMSNALHDLRDNGKQISIPVTPASASLRYKAYTYKGKTILLMVNISKDTPVTVTFDVNGKKAVDYFDNAWTIPVSNNKLTLTLPPNGTQVLLIN